MKDIDKFKSKDSRSALFLLMFLLAAIIFTVKVGPYITLYAESNQIKDCTNHEAGEIVKVNSNLMTPSKIINGYTATYCNDDGIYEEYEINSNQFKTIKTYLRKGESYYIHMIEA